MWETAAPVTAPRGPWIRSASWDFTFILGSAVLAGVPIASYYLITALTGVPPQAFQEHPALGIAMAMRQDFTLAPAHAHLNLLGWVSMALYGLYYRGAAVIRPRLAWTQAIVVGDTMARSGFGDPKPNRSHPRPKGSPTSGSVLCASTTNSVK